MRHENNANEGRHSLNFSPTQSDWICGGLDITVRDLEINMNQS